MIGTVFFDFGGVLTLTGGRDAIFRRYEERAGWQPGSMARLLYSGKPWLLVSTGRISEEEYRRRIEESLADLLPSTAATRSLPVESLPEELRGFEKVFFAEELNPQVVQIARSLGQQYSLGLLSNATSSLAELLVDRFALDGLFDTVVISALVGLRKPDPAIYYLAAERAGVPPAACLFIDDKERNTAVAARVGMTAITFRSAGQLTQELRRRLAWVPSVDE
jgi:putative hydrolase of the HAD superfamily